jgi:hypothetical protein
MTELRTYQEYATSLYADIHAVVKDGLPRREVLLDWLNDFLLRAKKRGFQMEQADLNNLTALDQFVRINGIPATVRTALE